MTSRLTERAGVGSRLGLFLANDRILRSLERGGSDPEVVAADQQGLGAVVVTSTRIHWTARSGPSGPYEIRTVLK